MSAFSPKSSAALRAEAQLRDDVEALLRTSEGIHVQRFERCMHEDGRVVALFLVESLTGPIACTAFVYPGGELEVIRGTFAA